MGAYCSDKALANSDAMDIAVRLNNKMQWVKWKGERTSAVWLIEDSAASTCQANTICKRWTKNKTTEIKKNQNTTMNSDR